MNLLRKSIDFLLSIAYIYLMYKQQDHWVSFKSSKTSLRNLWKPFSSTSKEKLIKKLVVKNSISRLHFKPLVCLKRTFHFITSNSNRCICELASRMRMRMDQRGMKWKWRNAAGRIKLLQGLLNFYWITFFFCSFVVLVLVQDESNTKNEKNYLPLSHFIAILHLHSTVLSVSRGFRF